MTVLEQGNITIHTENIFPIIKKSLYTDHEIFLRELISNGVDAIGKLKMVSFAGEFSGEIGEPAIQISIDKDKKTLSISDNGIGMSLDEVKKYINQVAFSSAEEFIEKYQKNSDQQIIGHFGLGFYSSFMVASLVEIDTLSCRDGSTPVHWSCDGSPSFEISESSRTERGTTITLTLQDEEAEYLEPARIKQLVKTYCDFMPVAISLDGEVINKQKAPWKESPQNLTKEDYLEFYRYLYPFEEDPLLWVHLNTDYPFALNGILYFPKLRPDLDLTKGQAKLFCNQVFVSDRCDEVIPKFLLPLRGVIDSTDIPLNVSRSALTSDRTVRRISDYISKKVGDRLKELYHDDREAYTKGWEDLSTFIKFGCLNDDKFKKQIEDIIIYRTTFTAPPAAPESTDEGNDDAWKSATPSLPYTTLNEYLERNKERHAKSAPATTESENEPKYENRVFYATDEASQAPYIQLHKSQGLEVLFLDSFIDTHFVSFLEREHSDIKFSRVDAELDSSLIQSDDTPEIIDPNTNKTRSEQIQEIFTTALNKPKVTIRTESLKGDNTQSTPPAMVLLPEFMRRMREMSAMMQQQAVEFPEEHILVVNTAHPLIQNLANINKGSIVGAEGNSPNQDLVNLVCHHIYDLALMAQKGVNADGMNAFVERSNQVLTKLTER
ncbi:molecular chaperone HtpG [Chamaesiphon polymorphus]|uniref:Molecular chaperone HtpG n=1 Tax=Chamaesiphon polymorphus CCALA 037 TaxID=2107692 RepID=A0A2T1G177_9CYAN|nr:molecular chaperone HtpG [Chamaesiphon polymorphus]PSB51004.1 molecular chaperone HtpG [Chamaesiphon polymorphus CCALA 037]